jgi:hypothetical protein
LAAKIGCVRLARGAQRLSPHKEVAMIEWFSAGGWGMFPILAAGVFSVVVGVRAAKAPTKRRVALLRTLPGLLIVMGLFTFGTDMWSVNVHLNDPAFVKMIGATDDRLALVALMGVTESAQAITLAGLFATLVAGLRAVVAFRGEE